MADFLPLPDRQYSVIYADPPWEYRQHGTTEKSRGTALKQYPTMTTADICNLPVRKICGGGGGLFSWGNFPKNCRGDQGPGGVGVSVQDRGLCVGEEKRQERDQLLGHGSLHPRQRGGVPAGRFVWV